MLIAVFGNFGVDNRGDDMILQGLMKHFSGDELIVFCGNPKRVTEVFGLKAYTFFPGGLRTFASSLFSKVYRQGLKESETALKNVDRVLIGGGGILVDRRVKAVSLWYAQLKKISESKIPYEFIANSFELSRKWARRLFEPFLMSAEKISVRDSFSQKYIKNLGIEAELVKDLAYQAELPASSNQKKKKIGFALCRWGLGHYGLSALRSFIDQKDTENYEFVGFAFQSKGDDDREIFSDLDPELPVISEWPEIVKEMSECELLVGMRLHSLILADRLGIPHIALAYQAKVKHYMKDQGRSDLVLDMNSVNEQKLQDLFVKAFAGAGE
jgi:polysaccharide pyruvyl transferase WcaK-like protein